MTSAFPSSSRSPRSFIALVATSILISGWFAPLVNADHLLEIRRTTNLYRGSDSETNLVSQAEENGKLFLSSTRARFDQGQSVSWILDSAANKLLLVRHDLGVYHVLNVPLVLEDHASESARALLEERSTHAVTEIEVIESDERRQIDGYSTRRAQVVGQSASGSPRFEYELWLSDEVAGDGKLYRAILREFGAADVVMRQLAGRLADLSGFPVLRRSVTTLDNGLRSIDERRLISVAEQSFPASTFEPPPEYFEELFNLDDWLSLR